MTPSSIAAITGNAITVTKFGPSLLFSGPVAGSAGGGGAAVEGPENGVAAVAGRIAVRVTGGVLLSASMTLCIMEAVACNYIYVKVGFGRSVGVPQLSMANTIGLIMVICE